MNVKSQYELMRKLRALADHPDTPPEEADSARLRIDEIEQRIRDTHAKIEEERKRLKAVIAKEKGRKKAAIHAILHRKPAVKSPVAFVVEWPIGWDGPKNRIETEEMCTDNGSIVLGWKCPGCGRHIEKVISARHRARLKGQPGGVDGFVGSIRDGRLNQLCDECWAKYR